MNLSHTEEYALRAMAWLAVHEEGHFVRVQELSEGANVPSAYLSKVMRRLVLAGLVKGQKGHGGGFALARKPEEIVLAEVLRAVGYSLDSHHCAFGWDPCNASNPCPLHPLWAELKHQIDRWMTENTLAEVLKRPNEAVQLRLKK